jgi:hypothetical protein
MSDLLKRVEKMRQYQQESRNIDRPSGYYWVRFPGQDRWQPGGWDNTAKMWSLMGGQDPWFEQQLVAVGQKIADPVGITESE